MNRLEFRSALRADDPAAIGEIARSTGFFEGVEGEVECAVDDARASLEDGVEKSGSEYLLAELDGRVVAFASFGPAPVCEDAWFVYWIAVSQSLRGKGCGRVLMNRILSELFDRRGARKVFLQTSGRPQYEPTRMFYLGLGFAAEAVLKDYYKAGEDCVFFSIDRRAFGARA